MKKLPSQYLGCPIFISGDLGKENWENHNKLDKICSDDDNNAVGDTRLQWYSLNDQLVNSMVEKKNYEGERDLWKKNSLHNTLVKYK